MAAGQLFVRCCARARPRPIVKSPDLSRVYCGQIRTRPRTRAYSCDDKSIFCVIKKWSGHGRPSRYGSDALAVLYKSHQFSQFQQSRIYSQTPISSANRAVMMVMHVVLYSMIPAPSTSQYCTFFSWSVAVTDSMSSRSRVSSALRGSTSCTNILFTFCSGIVRT